MTQLVCPACSSLNRLPPDRDASAAKCGKCGDKLFKAAPVEVSADALDRHRRSTRGAALLLDVWAPWCGPCRAMAPQFAAAATRLEPQVRLLKLNSDTARQTAAALGVRGIPALFLFRDGHVVAQTGGLMNADQIVAWTRQALAAEAA